MRSNLAVCSALALLGQVPPGVITAMASTIEELRTNQSDLVAQAQAIIAKADERGGDLTDEEIDEIAELKADAEKIGRQIEAREGFSRPGPGTGRRTAPNEVANAGNRSTGGSVPAQANRTDPRTAGFRNLGEFASCVIAGGKGDEGARSRLLNALGMNEGVGEDGGFLVPPEYRETIMKQVMGEEALLTQCDGAVTAKNAVGQPVDKTTPWSTSGIQVFWEGEGQAAAASKQPTELATLRLSKLFARVDLTDELLDDAPLLDSYLRVKTPEAMDSAINLAIVQGNGVGKPLGFMNSGALVTVPKATSQPADTIFHQNLIDMMGRFYAPMWPQALWLMHQDVWSRLPLMSFRDIGSYPSTATGTAMPVYIPPSGVAGAPYGMLLGRPIKVLQAMETIGDLGDIALCGMKAYRALTKAGGTRVDTSIHLKFDTDETVLRFIFRLGGTPWWSAPISPRDGPNTVSPFVTLASR